MNLAPLCFNMSIKMYSGAENFWGFCWIVFVFWNLTGTLLWLLLEKISEFSPLCLVALLIYPRH